MILQKSALAEAKVSPAYLATILKYEPTTGKLFWRVRQGRSSAGTEAGNLFNGYIDIRINGRLFKAHRIAWAIFYGEWPTHEIDHINRNRGDNKIGNLRLATSSQNKMNRPLQKNNKSGCAGVCFFKPANLWWAFIGNNGLRKSLGYFKEKEAAISARRIAETNEFGEFAYDPIKDFKGSIDLAYQTIRQRKAEGGPGWVPKDSAE